MSNESIITDILKREGGAQITNDPLDPGGRTQYGISERSNPEAWKDGKVTEAEARAIYERKYILGPGFDKIKDERLKAQLVDFGVNSGPFIAIKKLQEILGVGADGVLGPVTLSKVEGALNLSNLLVASRIRMFVDLVIKHPSQLRYLRGWVNRALEFLV